MEKYNYDFVDKIYKDLSKRIDAFITICSVLESDDIELYISTSNIIENLIKTLGIKKGFFTSEDLTDRTYFELISDLSFSNYLEELSMNISFIHKIRKIRNTQHDFSISNQYFSKEILLKEMLDISVVTYNALFSDKVSFVSQNEIKGLLLDNQVDNCEENSDNLMDISSDILKKIFSKAIDLLFSSNDINEIISSTTQKELDVNEQTIFEEKQIEAKKDNDNNILIDSKKIQETQTQDKVKKKITPKQYYAHQRMIFQKMIKEKKYSFDKNEAKKNISNRKKALENELKSEDVVTKDNKYLKTLDRGYVIKGENSDIRKDVKNKYANMIKLAKERGMLAPGFPGTAYDSALWNEAYLKSSVLDCEDLIIPICRDVVLICNTDRGKKKDAFLFFKLAVDLINRIEAATSLIKINPIIKKTKGKNK